MAKQLITFSKPTVCAAQGVVAGAGFSMVLACDVTIAAENIRLMQAFGNVGLLPDSGSCYLLARVVGLSRAKELVFSRRTVEADEAKRLGIVHDVVALEDLEQTALALDEQYAAGPTRAFAMAKVLLTLPWRVHWNKCSTARHIARLLCLPPKTSAKESSLS